MTNQLTATRVTSVLCQSCSVIRLLSDMSADGHHHKACSWRDQDGVRCAAAATVLPAGVCAAHACDGPLCLAATHVKARLRGNALNLCRRCGGRHGRAATSRDALPGEPCTYRERAGGAVCGNQAEKIRNGHAACGAHMCECGYYKLGNGRTLCHRCQEKRMNRVCGYESKAGGEPCARRGRLCVADETYPCEIHRCITCKRNRMAHHRTQCGDCLEGDEADAVQ